MAKTVMGRRMTDGSDTPLTLTRFFQGKEAAWTGLCGRFIFVCM